MGVLHRRGMGHKRVGVLIGTTRLVCDPLGDTSLVFDVLLVRFGGVVVLCHR